MLRICSLVFTVIIFVFVSVLKSHNGITPMDQQWSWWDYCIHYAVSNIWPVFSTCNVSCSIKDFGDIYNITFRSIELETPPTCHYFIHTTCLINMRTNLVGKFLGPKQNFINITLFRKVYHSHSKPNIVLAMENKHVSINQKYIKDKILS